jgi:CubicO group peptidase (beta-lactamase class C family)
MQIMKRFILLCFLSMSAASWGQLLSDTVALEAFMDGVINTRLKEKKIAGATLAIVHQGKIILKKGYGFADYQARIPVHPDTTLFRIGSISKMFVWVAVMQLVAEGRLDLNKDINTYLKDFQIPPGFDQPITLKHLMTHTPGFDDRVLQLFAKDESSLRPLGEILKQELPSRVRPPGTQASYSNHGTGIAAYIIEQVTGQSFYDYAEQKIVSPLQMKFFSFRQPLPARLKPYMSKGYRVVNKHVKEQPFEYVPLYPVGAASASAESMTHFMLALLQHGTYNQFQLLDSATLELMKSPAHRHHPQVNPMRYGFMDMSMNGETVIGHGGDTFWFHSLMALLPDHQTGIFLSFNTDTGGGVYMKVLEQFMDRYFPERQPLPPPMKAANAWLQKFAGEYIINRYSYHDLTKISSLFNRLHIAVADSTKLKVTLGEESTMYLPVDSTTFREEFKSNRIAFQKDSDGRIARAFLGGLPIIAMDKVGAWEASGTQTSILVIVVCAGLITLVFWPVTYFSRRKYQRQLGSHMELPFIARGLAWINFFFLVVFIFGFMMALGDRYEIVYGVPASVKILLIIPYLVILTTLFMWIMGFRLLSNKRYSLRARLYYMALCFISVLALVQLNYWNLIGYNY